jgi:hypothetical protein
MIFYSCFKSKYYLVT